MQFTFGGSQGPPEEVTFNLKPQAPLLPVSSPLSDTPSRSLHSRTLASVMFFERIRDAPTSGTSLELFPPPGMLFSRLSDTSLPTGPTIATPTLLTMATRLLPLLPLALELPILLSLLYLLFCF